MENTLLQLGPANAGELISAAQFAAADFEPPFIYERVRGRLAVMSPAGPEHRLVSRPFRRELGGYWARHPDIVEDVDVEGWVATVDETERIPDIAVYLIGSGADLVPPHRTPDMIFEFVSQERADQERDYIYKRAEYHAVGVREYVIIDRFRRLVLVLTWAEDDYTERRLTPDQAYTTPLLPGLRVELSEVFA